MDATAKIDLYLLKGGKETDDYASRRLACSDATLSKPLNVVWWNIKPSVLGLNIEKARLSTPFLLPGRTYRLVHHLDSGEQVSYYKLVDYRIEDGNIYLTVVLL